ncbi:hypothetical protein [Legionella bononiensis]|uniref:Dot/Icm T4SS effector n=1 Tax=Legionella bononiensis TaxID=2793102 RepID=A0ABS1WAX2_9GAMM|nr:hypothetical protein [Legionella bononiensis]MBL7480261.1 hypothetical protein [Legionella bononiensis]MBL7526507.1 hypothetical protein [Legionella bononiensis]MBL7562999.1 hypothetical protein [Legionella bononiensis]
MGDTVRETHDCSVVDDDSTSMSYANINQLYPDLVIIKDGHYRTQIGGASKPWILFNSKDTSQPPKIKDSISFANVYNEYGSSSDFIESPWKIHLSIHPDDLGKAWDIIYPLLSSRGFPVFKTTRLAVSRVLYNQMQQVTPEFLEKHNLSVEDKNQSLQDIVRVYNGMQITIYIERGKERAYNALLQEIEPLLYKAGITPGIIDKSDRALGIYSSVRHVGKGYTSHEKVSGYKAAEEKDIFKAIKFKLKDIHINWNTLDYKRQILKAQMTLQQVVDARRKYELAIFNKSEFIQVCDVATEYFDRWHHLIKRAPDATDLSTKNQGMMEQFKKWISDGQHLIPSIRKEKIRKIKEAEDILHATSESSSLNDIPPQRIQRQLARKNLLGTLPPDFLKKHSGILSVPSEKKGDTASIIRTLSEQRRETFDRLKSVTVPQKKRTLFLQESAILPVFQVKPDTSRKLFAGQKVATTTLSEQQNKDLQHNKARLTSNPGLFEHYFWLGGLSGATLGLIGGASFIVFFLPLTLELTLMAVALATVLTGIGFLTGNFIDASFLGRTTQENENTQASESLSPARLSLVPEFRRVASAPVVKSEQERSIPWNVGLQPDTVSTTSDKDELIVNNRANL